MAAAGGTQPWSLVLSGPQEGVAGRALAQPVSLGARLSREQHHAELVAIAADGASRVLDPPQLARFRIGGTPCASQQFIVLRLCPVFELELRPIGGLAVDRAKTDDWLRDNNLAGPYFNAKVANLHR